METYSPNLFRYSLSIKPIFISSVFSPIWTWSARNIKARFLSLSSCGEKRSSFFFLLLLLGPTPRKQPDQTMKMKEREKKSSSLPRNSFSHRRRWLGTRVRSHPWLGSPRWQTCSHDLGDLSGEAQLRMFKRTWIRTRKKGNKHWKPIFSTLKKMIWS